MSGVSAGNRWAVVLSNRAVKALRKLERDQRALETIHKKIKFVATLYLRVEQEIELEFQGVVTWSIHQR